MNDKRVQLTINNANISEMRRIESALNKSLTSYKYTIKINEKVIIINSDILTKVEEIIKSVDEKITISTEEVVEKYRYVFYLENLDCANCAAKIERICKRKISSELVVVDFATLKIIIVTTKKYDNFDIRMLIQECAEMVDPNIEVKERIVKKEEKDTKNIIKRRLFIIGVIIFLVFEIFKDIMKFGFGYDTIWLYVIVYCGFIPAYLLIGYDVLYGAFKNIKSGRIFDEKFLISLATITAFIIMLYDEAFLLMAFYQIGEMIQHIIVSSSRKNVTGLVSDQVEHVTIDVDGAKQDIGPDGVMVDDIIYVTAGNKIILDGVIVEGNAILDCKSLTGESIPVSVQTGSKVMSGSICIEGTIKIRITKTYEESTVKLILNMVDNANINKSKKESIIAKFAKYYTPIVCIIAVILAIVLPILSPEYDFAWENGYNASIRTAMIFLVASCPCALVISIPLTYFGAIGNASKNGILVKGSTYLESLGNIGAVVFDKTGTLTTGSFIISNVVTYHNYTKEDVLYYAAHVESTSTHVIAQSVVKAYDGKIDTSIVKIEPQQNANGVSAYVNNKFVRIGNKTYLNNLKINSPEVIEDDRSLFVIIDGVVAGYLVIEDKIREESKQVVSNLKKKGIKRIVMLTGDSFNIASNVSKQIGIEEIYYNMLPMDKVEMLKKIKEECPKQKVVFVGDGINDALVINESDVGIAVSGVDNSATTQIADVVLINDDLNKVDDLINLSIKAKIIIYENIVFTLLIKFGVMILATFNFDYYYNTLMVYLGMFADVGVSIIAVLNTLRILKRKKK